MLRLNRRQLLHTAASGAVLLTVPGTTLFAQAKKDEPKPDGPFTLPKLPYAHDALEPHIDAKTMEIHHGKHHQAYVNNLNKAVAGTEMASKPIEEILRNLARVQDTADAKIRNNGGGHYNHTLFWQMMAKNGGKPSAELTKAVGMAVGSVELMLSRLTDMAMARFGSGWGWIVAERGGRVEVMSTPYQDNPVMNTTDIPILGVDVWEHAYYLKYQNRRDEYLKAWLNIINWEFVNERYEMARKG